MNVKSEVCVHSGAKTTLPMYDEKFVDLTFLCSGRHIYSV